MYDIEREEFAKLLTDLCTSVNRPCTADLLRVFWDDLQHVPLAQIQRQAQTLRASGKKTFNSNDLRPPPEERSMFSGPDNASVLARIDAHFLRYVWGKCTYTQRLTQNQEWIWSRDKIAPRPIALVIKADGERPGYKITLADCDLDFDPPPAATRPAMLSPDFDEAGAARDILARQQ